MGGVDPSRNPRRGGFPLVLAHRSLCLGCKLGSGQTRGTCWAACGVDSGRRAPAHPRVWLGEVTLWVSAGGRAKGEFVEPRQDASTLWGAERYSVVENKRSEYPEPGDRGTRVGHQ